MDMKYRHLATGIVIGIAIVGCIAGVVGEPEKADEGRFQLQLMQPMASGAHSHAGSFLVLDTETGTAISWRHGESEPLAIHNFYQEGQ